MSKQRKPTANKANSLRIIGGQWRGRKLAFPDVAGLRPTPDRVRETAFNWLMPVIQGARCLDLFAGSGALGLEAVSRGAAVTVLVDSQTEVVDQLRQNIAQLEANDQVRVQQAEALAFLDSPAESFDIVFLDPPYHAELLTPCLDKLQQGWIHPDSWIYFEASRDEPIPELPPGWALYRQKSAGQVNYYLARRN